MAAIRYQVYFSDSTVTSGDPGKTGLTPAFTLCDQMASPGTAVVSPPAITADGGGFYGWNWDTEANGEFYWKIDGGAGLTVNTDRYLAGQCASAEPMRSADIAKVAAAIFTTPMTKVFLSPSTASSWTLAGLLFSLVRRMFSRSVSGTTETVYDFDNVTAVHTITLNSSTSPTSALQAS